MQGDRFMYTDPELSLRLNEKALQIARKSGELVKKSGLREFYNPESGKGMRVDNFAWSTLAYLLVDKISEMEEFKVRMQLARAQFD